MKKMKEKGFTLVELLAVIIIIGILVTFAVVSASEYLRKSRNDSFELAENTFLTEVKNAYADCLANSSNSFCQNHQSFGFSNETIYLKELIENRYAEPIKNPYDTNTYCDKENSYVVETSSNTSSPNQQVSYRVCLICGEKKSSTCSG